jgi:hypothetical protein
MFLSSQSPERPWGDLASYPMGTGGKAAGVNNDGVTRIPPLPILLHSIVLN